MRLRHSFGLVATLTVAFAFACRASFESNVASDPHSANGPGALVNGLGSSAHEQEVMRSSYCASCHPETYAEHSQNTHGRAFTDEEVRLGTGRFSQGDCIICHTPRPIFETGIGQNPTRRYNDLEDGDSCMTCHWKAGEDYSRFTGGAQCRTAFDPRVGTVEACASCHRNHGTPYQWESAVNGKQAGNVCIDCHMPEVERAVAVGGPVRTVHAHVFPASRSESQLHRAYAYDAKIDGDHVVVTLTNNGAGHNFPTELKQRAVESLIVVRDADGKEVGRSRMTFRDPYKRPYGLALPVNTQIPSGESREHRVPLPIANGSVECELHYKLYFPIEDDHPDLARRLESRRLVFDGVAPSKDAIESEPDVRVTTPEGISPERAGAANLVDYAHPKIGKVDVDIPSGSSTDDIQRLIALFQFPVPQANAEARRRLIAIGASAVPALVAALGSWDNKTWNQAEAVLFAIGEPAKPAVGDALGADSLYVRIHACELAARLGLANDGVRMRLKMSLARPNALDRSFAASAIGELKLAGANEALRKLAREDRDPDVLRAAARALAQLGDRAAIEDLRGALTRFEWPETRREVAEALARLGDSSAIPTLIDGLSERDDLVRESYFESFFAVTGVHFSYEPLAPESERLESIARIRGWWAKHAGDEALRKPVVLDLATRAELRTISETFGGSDGTVPVGDDAALRRRLLDLGPRAVASLSQIGLKYPPGFSQKRALICEVLGEIGDRDAAPALISALRDPVIAVAAWACQSLGSIDDESALPAVQRYHQRLLSLAATKRIPPEAGTPDALLAMAAATCSKLGDTHLDGELIGYLLSDDDSARNSAYAALRERFGSKLDYDPAMPIDERRAAVARFEAIRP